MEFYADCEFRRDPHYWFFVNLEDPNERGYDVIRRLVWLEMLKVQTHWQ